MRKIHPIRYLKRAMRFTRGQSVRWNIPGIAAKIRQSIGNGSNSSVVMAPLQWLMRTFPEAPLVIDTRKSENQWEQKDDHPMLDLLDNPNEHYSADLLWRATISELVLDGNAYWIKVRGDQQRITELWWVPSAMMEPKWPTDGSKFISYYEYRPGVEPIKYPVEDIVHFRWDLDPENPRKGLSPLQSVLREIFADDEAGRFSSALLANMGVPGLIVSPDTDQAIGDDDLEETKQSIIEKTTGSRRGEPMVFGSATKVQQFGFSPQQMDMRTLRKVPEERVTAVLGVAAIVCGLGAGLDRSTFANFKEAREASYEGAMIPLQRLIATVLRLQLLKDYESDISKTRVRFDLDNVRALQEDQNAVVERKLQELRAGAITVAEYLRETGREAKPIHDVYLRNTNIVMVPADELDKKPEPILPAGGPPKLDENGKPLPPDPAKPMHLPPAPDPSSGMKDNLLNDDEFMREIAKLLRKEPV